MSASDWNLVEEIILETDRDGRVTWANMHARVVLRSEFEGMRLADFVNDMPPEALTDWLREVSSDGRKCRHQSVEMNFRAGPARVTLHVDRNAAEDEPIRVRISLVDAEADPTNGALIRVLQEMRYALDQATIVAVTDRKGVIIHVNERFCEISGYRREELMGQTHRIIRSDRHDSAFFKNLWATIGHGKVWRGEICNRTKAGELYWVDTTIVPLVDEAGHPQRYLAIRSDITAAKQSEAALRQAVADLETLNARIAAEQARRIRTEKLSSVGQLAAGVAHEINNPLAGAIACVRSLRDGSVSERRRSLYFETVLDSMSRIRSIVRALLDYARPLPPSNSAVAVEEIVEANATLLHSICQKKSVQIVIDPVPDGAVARGDRGQLAQATMNVLMNACHASPPRSVVRVSFTATDDQVAIHVKDDGPGIPEGLRDRIFDPFYSTKPEGEGTGLGLSVTLGIIERHGGCIDVECPEEGGTQFTLLLPRFHHSD